MVFQALSDGPYIERQFLAHGVGGGVTPCGKPFVVGDGE